MHYFGQGFHRISFFESISSTVEGEVSHLDHIIIFDDSMSNLIYKILEISWLGIYNVIIRPHDVFSVSS